MTAKEFVRQMPLIRKLVSTVRPRPDVSAQTFESSEEYWRRRYQLGGNSGSGSYGRLAKFKSEILNRFVAEHSIASVIEFGCGDGNQLKLANYPQYLGFDVSPDCIERCKKMFATDSTKSFREVSQHHGAKAELCLSLDVIYHLVETDVFEQYMHRMFDSAIRYVIIYSTNYDFEEEVAHVKHRTFSTWVEQNATDWHLQEHIPNRYPYQGDLTEGSNADFFVYRKDHAA